jgi:hypothetical protein
MSVSRWQAVQIIFNFHMTDCLHKNENVLLLMPNLCTNIVIRAFSAGVAAGVSTT